MEKGLELVVVAAILMIIAGVAFFMLNDSTQDFTDTTRGQISGSECRLMQARYESAVQTNDMSTANDICREASSDCDWASSCAQSTCPPGAKPGVC